MKPHVALFTLLSVGSLLGLLVLPTGPELIRPALAGGGSQLVAVDLTKSEAMSFAKSSFNPDWFQELNEGTADGRTVKIVKFLSTDNPQTVVNFEIPNLVSADYPGTTGQFGGKFASVAATLRKFAEVTPTPVPTVNPSLPSFVMELVARWCPTCPLYGFSPLIEVDGSISTRGVLFTANNNCYLWNITDRINVVLEFNASGKNYRAQSPVTNVNVCEFASVRVNPVLFLPAVSRQPKGRLDDPSLSQCIDTAVEINGVTGGDGAQFWSRVFSDIDRGWHYEAPLPTTGMFAPKGGKTDLTNNRVATPGQEIKEPTQALTWWCQSYRF